MKIIPILKHFSGIHIFGLQTTNKAFQFPEGPPPNRFPTAFDQFPTGRYRSETVGNGRKRSETVGNQVEGGPHGENFEKKSSLYIFGLQTTNKALHFQTRPPPGSRADLIRPSPTGRIWSDSSDLVGLGRTRSDSVGFLGRTGRLWSDLVSPRCWGGPD